jgi:hypothetical protein
MIGFRPTPPPVPPVEHVLWIVRKDIREARALVRVMPHGRELRCFVGDQLAWSRLFRDHDDSRALGEMAEGACVLFEDHGWVRDLTV